MTEKENISCAECKSDKVIALAWVNKTTRKFIKWAEGNKNHICLKCNKTVDVQVHRAVHCSDVAWRML